MLYHRASADGAYLGGRWPPLRRAGQPLPVKLLSLFEELGLELHDRSGADIDLFGVLRHRRRALTDRPLPGDVPRVLRCASDGLPRVL